jgi:hypothetical protein
MQSSYEPQVTGFNEHLPKAMNVIAIDKDSAITLVGRNQIHSHCRDRRKRYITKKA